MGYREIFDAIKKSELGQLYLFYGEEEYIKEQALNQMADTLIQPDFRDFNSQILDGSIASADQIINACETLPFMGEKRLVVVKDSFLLEEKKGSPQEEQIREYLDRLPTTTCLVFYNRGSVDKRKSIVSRIQKLGQVVAFDYLNEKELHRWTAAALKKNGKEISLPDLQYLVYLTGSKLEDVQNEVNKLAAYLGEERMVHREAIDKVVSRNLEHTIFQLVEAVGEKKSGPALTYLDELLYEGQSILAILSMIARQFRLIHQCKSLEARGHVRKSIAERLKTPAFVVDKCLRQGSNFTLGQLEKGLEDCLQVDYGIKSGRMEGRIGIEMLIIKMTRQ